MFLTLRIICHMGELQRLFPFWIAAIILCFAFWAPWFVLAIGFGIFAQFFVEYVLHRFLFHRKPPNEQGVFNRLYRAHIGHHEFPNDPRLLTTGEHWFPLIFGLVTFAVQALLLWPVMGFVNAFQWSVISVFLGSVSAYAFYEYCHTLAHLDVPKGWFGKRVTRSHMLHHFRDHQATYHVSFGTGWVDDLFGTGHDVSLARERFDRETLYSLGMNPEDLRLVLARKTFGLPQKPDPRSFGSETTI